MQKIFWYKQLFRKSSVLVFLSMVVLSGFLLVTNGADATLTSVGCTDTGGTCIDPNISPFDGSLYQPLPKACSGIQKCYKLKPVEEVVCVGRKSDSGCTKDETVDTSGTFPLGVVCCKATPRPMCPTTDGKHSCSAVNCDGDTLDPDPTYKCDSVVTSYCCKQVDPKDNGPGVGDPKDKDNGPGVGDPKDNGPGDHLTPTKFKNPLQYDTVQDVLGELLSALQGIIVILSIIFIVIGAVLYVTSAGNDKQITMAKSAITASMIGLAIGIAAPSFLKEVSGILGWDAAPASVSGAISLTAILTNVLNFLLGIVGILSIIMLIIGALMILSSAGSEDRIEDGKKIVKYSIIGIIVAFSALVIVKQIATLFVV